MIFLFHYKDIQKMIIDTDPYDDYNDRNTRIKSLNKSGWTEKAFKDVDAVIRLKAYRKLGFTKAALNDDHHAIRFEAYSALGWSKHAFEDAAQYIRNYAAFVVYKNY
jgi:hypothetical protein